MSLVGHFVMQQVDFRAIDNIVHYVTLFLLWMLPKRTKANQQYSTIWIVTAQNENFSKLLQTLSSSTSSLSLLSSSPFCHSASILRRLVVGLWTWRWQKLFQLSRLFRSDNCNGKQQPSTVRTRKEQCDAVHCVNVWPRQVWPTMIGAEEP